MSRPPAAIAGLFPGDERVAARIGLALSGLPGRWRWGIEGFLRWWLAELAGLLPRRDRPAMAGVPRIDAEDGLEFSFLMVPSALGLVRERVAIAITERTPFSPDEVVAGYRLDPAADEVRVTVRLVPLVRLPDGIGTVADRLVLAGEGRDMPVRLPADRLGAVPRAGRRAARRRRAAVAGAWLLAVALVLVVPIILRRHALAQEETRLEEARAMLAPSVRRAAAARAGQMAAGEARQRRAAALRPLPLLDRLTRLLDDDTTLSELSVSGREGRIAGIAAVPGALPALLERDPMLADVRLLAPVSRDAETGRQRFEIGFTVATP